MNIKKLFFFSLFTCIASSNSLFGMAAAAPSQDDLRIQMRKAIIYDDIAQIQDLILRQSADIFYQGRFDDEESAFMFACGAGNLPIINAMLESIKKKETLNILLLSNEFPNARDEDFPPELIDRMLKPLIASRIDTADDVGNTPLIVAAENGHIDIVRLLLNYGAQVNAKNKLMKNSLIRAIERNHIHIARLLIDSGSDTDTPDHHAQTPLMKATYTHDTDLIEALINAGADLNSQDHNGSTALMYAAESGKIKIVKALLTHHANRELHNTNGETALSIAQRRELHPLFLILDGNRDETLDHIKAKYREIVNMLNSRIE